MSLLRAARARLRALVRRRAADSELGDEIRFHIELETEKNVRAGMTPAEAKRIALAHFGGVEQVREAHRDVRRLALLEDAVADVRFAFRMLRRSPVLTTTAVITIALGIGANAAIFSAVNAVVLQPLPFKDPYRLVVLADENPVRQWHRELSSVSNYLDWRDGTPAFSDVASYDYGSSGGTITGIGASRRGTFGDVSGNFFSVLGVHAELGRTLEEAETWDDTPATIVLSHAAWVRDFGGDPSAIGRTITIDNDVMRIVGVMPASFTFPYDNLDGWVAFRWSRSARTKEMYRREHWLHVIARLRPDATLATANAQVNAVAARLERDFPRLNHDLRVSVTPLHEFLVGDTRFPLLVLLTSVALLLMIACANVANLLLVQAGDRQRETALRLALGADRMRVVRQAITESLVLSMVGGACGFAVGWLGARTLSALQPKGLLRVSSFGVDGRVMLYVALVTTVAGLLFGVAPALWTRRRDPADVLRGGSRSSTQTRTMRRWSDGLVVTEIALALVMTTGAALLVRTAWKVSRVDPGYDSRGVVAAGVELYHHGYDSAAVRNAFGAQFLERARHIPGVTSAARTGILPLMDNAWRSGFQVVGRATNDANVESQHWFVSPEYFPTLRVPLLRGRLFTDADRDSPVILINETFARRYFASQDPVGQRLTFDKTTVPGMTEFTIVGVVGDVRDRSLIEPARIAIVHPFSARSGGYFVLRTDGDPAALVAPLRAILHDMDPRLALSQPRFLDKMRAQSMARQRFFAMVLGIFAVVGLVLATVGVYGVLAQLARGRAREMGIRLALGAPLAGVRWLVVGHGLRLAVIGLLIGGVVALFATRALTSLLFGVAPHDPVAFAGVVVLLIGASAAASWIPARRSTRESPAAVLRAE